MANILNVISAVTPMGGTITKLRELMTLSKKHRHFLYHPGFKFNEQEIKKELEWYKGRGIPAYCGIYGRNIFKNAQAVTRIIKENNIDVVHFYFNHEQSFAGLVKWMNPNVKLVRSIVGFDVRLSWFRRMVVRASLSYIPNYVYISNYIKDLYEQEYPILKIKNTTIIHNGPVNIIKAVKPLVEREKIVVIGGLCERKNSMVLIEAMNYIVNFYKRKELILYILGDGPERKKCELKIREYGIEKNVILVGYTKQVSQYLDDCAVYVHPATTEGFGIAVVEAMQMHCPCIVADKGALPELIVDGESGYVIDAYDSKLWAEKIIYLTDHISERIRMGEKAQQRAGELFSLKSFVYNHDALYEALLNKN